MSGNRKGQKPAGGPPASGEELLPQLEKQGRGRVEISRNSEKVSQALWEVAKPLLGRSKKRAQVEQGLRTASMAWNLALLPEDKRQEMIEQALAPVKWPFRWFVRRMIKTMLDRKKQLYPQERRMIADVQVTGEAPDWKVKVSTVQQR